MDIEGLPKTVVVFIVMVFILIVLVLVLITGFSEVQRGKTQIEIEQVGKFLDTLQNVVLLVSYPETKVTCSQTAEGMNNYDIDVDTLQVKFSGKEGASMDIVPVIYFKGTKARDIASTEVNLKSGEPTGIPKVRFSVQSHDPPIIDERGNKDFTERNLQLHQNLYLGAYKFGLKDISVPTPSLLGGNLICKAKMLVECREQSEVVTIYLTDKDNTCEMEKDVTVCSKQFTLCQKQVKVQLEKFDNPSSFATCAGRKPFFTMHVEDPPTDDAYIKKIQDEKRKGIVRLGEDYIIGFWRAPKTPQEEECIQKDLITLGDCQKNFLGAYLFRVPPENYPHNC